MANDDVLRSQGSPGDDARSVTAPSEPRDSHVVIDLTDATLARHGGAVLDLAAEPASVGAPPARPAAALLSPLALLLAVNLLNVLDAALTVLWIQMGIAVEANPIVEAVGFPAKVVGVAAGSYVVYRLRPRWLLVPIAALTLVFLYHLVGAAVTLRP